ncbi:hypothetical protein BgiMline_011578, partial [Biomphalaria glabrata]
METNANKKLMETNANKKLMETNANMKEISGIGRKDGRVEIDPTEPQIYDKVT